MFQVNHHSFSTFANTISFNVSRYPTPVESTNSKDYSSPVSNPENSETSDTAAETGVKNLDIAPAEHGEDALTTTSDTGAIEYKPAEYFRGDQIAHLAQSSKIMNNYQLLTINIVYLSVVVSKAITNVKPEVLASGRILTHMTPIPSTLK